MNRRAGWLAGAALIVGAALTGVGFVATGGLDQTDVRIILTLVTGFLVLAAVASSLELLDRGVARPLAVAVLALAPLGIVAFMLPIWTSVIGNGETRYGNWAETALAWSLAALLATTARLVAPVLVLAVAGAGVGTTIAWTDTTSNGWIKALASLAIATAAAWLVGPALARARR